MNNLDSGEAQKFKEEYERLFYKQLLNDKQALSVDRIWHYTSVEGFYNMMEGDSIWVSNTRFSNDFSEEKLIGEDWLEREVYNDDNYIISFCENGDLLSVWRGYCPYGGVSFQLDLSEVQSYSILHSDYDSSGKYEQYYNSPLSVVYVDKKKPSKIDRKVYPNYDKMMDPDLKKSLDNIMSDYSDENKKDMMCRIVPYLKHGKFREELESRFVFTNHNSELSRCIRYRNVNDQTKVPYMVVKFGEVGKNKMSCRFDFKDYSEDKLKELSEAMYGQKIFIPLGSNQESVFNNMHNTITMFNKAIEPSRKIKLFCDGHIPIRKVIIAPMHNNKRIMEQIKHFCKSKYWLRDVEVDCSEIPYIPSANKLSK